MSVRSTSPGRPRTRASSRVTLVCLSASLVVSSIGCRQLRDDATARAERAEGASQEIVAAVVWPGAPGERPDDPAAEQHFWHGVDTAAAKVAAAGGVLGRRLVLLRVGEDGSVAQGRAAAQTLTENLDVVAVLGYREPNVATVTSIMFEYANIVMIAAGSSSGRLTRDGFVRVFRTLPTDAELGARLADYSHDRHLGQTLVVFENDPYGHAIANAYEARAEDHHLSIAARIAFERGAERSFTQRLRELRGTRIDAVLLAAKLPEAADALVLLRREGISAPVLGADGLDSEKLFALPEAEGTIVATVFHVDRDGRAATDDAVRGEVRGARLDPAPGELVRAYRAAYGHDPDTWAAQGYDAVLLLARAIERARSASPGAIADALRSPEGWSGATGRLRFNARGDAVDRAVTFVRIEHGKPKLVDASRE